MKKILFAMLTMVLILGSIVLAETQAEMDAQAQAEIEMSAQANEEYKQTYQQAMDVRYEHLACKVDFTVKQIDLFTEYVANLGLEDDKEQLQADLAELKLMLNESNKTQFNTYIAGEFRADFAEATNELSNAKKNFRQYNLSADDRATIVAELKDYRQEYADCVGEKEERMANLAYKYFIKIDNNWDKRIQHMSGKGLNTTELVEIRAEIEERNAKLKELIDAGNTTALNAYLKELRSEHIHAAARFEIERLKSYKGKLSVEAEKYNLGHSMTNIDASIDKAERNAQEGKKYEDGEYRETWDSIREANKEIKDTSKEILRERIKDKVEDRRGKSVDANVEADVNADVGVDVS